MSDKSMSVSFAASLCPEMSGTISDLLEIGLDSFLDDGVLREIPILSTAINLYKIGRTVNDRYHLKKLAAFLDAIRLGICDEEQRQEYSDEFCHNQKFHDEELEYVLILVGRYIGEYKPRLLAKLYLSYLQGEVQWLEFTQYAEIIDRFLPGDFEALKSAFSGKDYTYPSGSGPRLQSMGLVIAEPSRVGINLGSITVRSSGIKHSFTEFGEKLIEILTK